MASQSNANHGGFSAAGEWKRVFGEWKDVCLNFSSTADDLQSITAQYFSSTIAAESEQERAIAILIQSLQQALTSPNLRSRELALACLKGSLAPSSSSSITLSLSVMKLVGDFLLGQCGPIVVEMDNHNEIDLDERIRDMAVGAVAALLVTKSPPNSLEDDITLADILKYRIQLSQEAIRRRCAIPAYGGDTNMMETDEEGPTAPRGLASLPRSRRSLCFQVLQSTLDGVKSILDIIHDPNRRTVAVRKDVSISVLGWTELAVNCLHGESDPRCLIQLLNLFGAIQESFTNVLENNFPVDAMFDAVSAYYPVQFTPPPNMAVPVTQEDLVRALWKILSFTAYDGACTRAGRDTMFGLTLGLILDQLLPLPEDEPPTLQEQKDALIDLQSLMGISTHNVESEKGVVGYVIAQNKIEAKALGQISSALRSIHSKTAIQGATATPGSVTPQQVSLLCRDLTSHIAFACEKQTQNRSYWQIFVKDASTDILQGASTSSLSRPDIVFLSCLAGCGGVQSLRFVLDNALPRLLQSSNEINFSASEDDFSAARNVSNVTTALFGIAAFCAAVQTFSKRHPEGIVLTPHPLRGIESKIIGSITQVWEQSRNSLSDFSDSPQVLSALASLRVAVVRAMETVLMVLPPNSASDEIASVKGYLSDLCAISLDQDAASEQATKEKQFILAVSRSLGVLVGACFDFEGESSSTDKDFSLLSIGSIQNQLLQTIFPSLLHDVSSEYVQLVLAMACSQSKRAANVITGKLMETVVGRIQSPQIIDDMASVLTRGGSNASEAFQNAKSLFKLRSALLPQQGNYVEENTGVSSLELPMTTEEAESEEHETRRLAGLLEPLLPLYATYVSPSHMNDLLVATSKVIPPLNSGDRKHLGILLPFLSKGLRSFASLTELSPGHIDELVSFLPELILSSAVSTTRMYATNCLMGFLVSKETEECPCMALWETQVMPLIHRLSQEITVGFAKKAKQHEKSLLLLKQVGETISFTGSIASAAIQRGGSSSATADKLVKFLIGLSCAGQAEAVSSKGSLLIDFSDVQQASASVQIWSVSAFGGIMSSGPYSALWKQRLSFVAWQSILSSKQENGMEVGFGVIGASAFIVCCNRWNGMPTKMSSALTDILLAGLSSRGQIPGSIRKVLLSSVVKLLSLKPMEVEQNIMAIVMGVLLSYASTDKYSVSDALTCKILALQALQTIPSVLSARQAVLAVKPAVVSILEQAMMDKSSILRHGAVEVRNSWFVI